MSDRFGSLGSNDSPKPTASLTQKNTRTTPHESNGYPQGADNNSNSLRNAPAPHSNGGYQIDQNGQDNLNNFNAIHQAPNSLLKYPPGQTKILRNQTANPVLEGIHHSPSDNLLGSNNNTNPRYTSNTVLQAKQYPNSHIVPGEYYPSNGPNRTHGIFEHQNAAPQFEGRLDEYGSEEDNIICARFPHLKFCGCAKNSLQNLVTPIEVTQLYL